MQNSQLTAAAAATEAAVSIEGNDDDGVRSRARAAPSDGVGVVVHRNEERADSEVTSPTAVSSSTGASSSAATASNSGSILQAKSAIAAAALAAAANQPLQHDVGRSTPTSNHRSQPLPIETTLLEAKTAIAAANAVGSGGIGNSTTKGSDDMIQESPVGNGTAVEEEDPADDSIRQSATRVGAISISTFDSATAATTAQQQQDVYDEYSVTAQAVSAFTVGTRTTSASTSNAVHADDERARFRQQVRDSLAAEVAQAVVAPQPDALMNSSQDHVDGQQRQARQRCRRWVFVAALLLIAIVAAAASAWATQQPSGVVESQSTGTAPTAPPSAILADAPEIVWLSNGRQAFTTTSQLYKAVDDYDAAMQTSESDTAEGSLVAEQYGYPMGTWDVSRLTDFSRVFMVNREQVIRFDDKLAPLRTMVIPDLSGWNVSKATTMEGMFAAAVAFTGEGLADWDVGLVTDFSYCFAQALQFVGNVSRWNTSAARNMNGMLQGTLAFNGALSLWDVSAVEFMSGMFNGASKFSGSDLNRWDVRKVTTMSQMFGMASSFNGNIADWNTSRLEQMIYMFQFASSFNGDLSRWNLEKVTSLAGVFLNADNFVGGDLTAWNLSRVMDLQGVFKECEMFNGDVSLWDVSRVVRFDLAFEFATSFAGDVSKWNTGAALSTRQMFKDTWSFSGNLSSWNTSNVVDMFEMFHNARSFNGDLSNWDIRNLTMAAGMFKETAGYNHSLCAWKDRLSVNAVTMEMFRDTGCANTGDPSLVLQGGVSATLAAWEGPFCAECNDGAR